MGRVGDTGPNIPTRAMWNSCQRRHRPAELRPGKRNIRRIPQRCGLTVGVLLNLGIAPRLGGFIPFLTSEDHGSGEVGIRSLRPE